MKNIILFSNSLCFSFLMIVIGLFIPQDAFAILCPISPRKTATLTNTSCVIDSAVVGVDNPNNNENSVVNTATLDIGNDVNNPLQAVDVVIYPGKAIVAGQLNIKNNVAIHIESGGNIITGPLYVLDSDSDGFADNFTLFTSSASGRRRLGLMRDFDLVDCDINTPGATNTRYTFYRDADVDGQGDINVTSLQCLNVAPSGYVANSTDCYDANANAKVGSGFCGTTHRGDGSFDYNCVNGQTKCGTIYNYNTSGTSYGYDTALGNCNNRNMRCDYRTNVLYGGKTYSCGQTGAVCSLFTGTIGGNCDCNGTCSNGADSCGTDGESSGHCNGITLGVQACQ